MNSNRTFFVIFILINYTLVAESILALKKHDTLDYNDFSFEIVNPVHGRQKRQALPTNNTGEVEDLVFSKTRLKFRAFERDFNIFLKRDLTLVSENIDIEVRYSYRNKPNVVEHTDADFTANNYVGYVEGEPKSSVVCYFEKADRKEPLIYAQIRLEKERNKHELYTIEPAFHGQAGYIIYRSEDIDSDVISNGNFNSTVCKPKYAEQDIGLMGKPLVKRDAKLIEKQKTVKRKNRCNIALVADYKFFNSIGNLNVRQTTAYLLNIIGAINSIYTNTVWKFDEDTPFVDRTNYGFSVDKVIVLATPEETKADHYNAKASSDDADIILKLFSEEDWSPYCLAHLFTFQSFQHSVLGLAYVSSPLPYAIGGICSRPQYRSNDKALSVNIGLSSYKSASLRQGRLLQREAELVTAHEFGHNWGSEHDPNDSPCAPDSGSQGGNFLMYAYSNQGHDRNNDDFSQCSVNSVSQVLKTKSHCFVSEKKTYCGNGHIENDEECDAGLDTQKGTDSCCDQFCKLRPQSQCSDSNHNCCQNCKIANKGYKCWSSPNYLDCFEDHSYCDGSSKDCPVQAPLSVGSECSTFDFGKCDATGHCMSMCQYIKGSAYAPCLCTKKEEKCRICCRYSSGNVTEECKPFDDVKNMFGPYYLSKGRPCHDGICNQNAVCEHKVKDYVSRFWKVIQKVTVSGFVEFMKRNIVATIILISLSLWVPFSCCIHFCIDKRNRAEANRQINQIMQNRKSAFTAKTSDAAARERLLIRTENFDENKPNLGYL